MARDRLERYYSHEPKAEHKVLGIAVYELFNDGSQAIAIWPDNESIPYRVVMKNAKPDSKWYMIATDRLRRLIGG